MLNTTDDRMTESALPFSFLVITDCSRILASADVFKQSSKSHISLNSNLDFNCLGIRAQRIANCVRDSRRPSSTLLPTTFLWMSVHAVTFTYGCTYRVTCLVHVRQPTSQKTTCLVTLFSYDSLVFGGNRYFVHCCLRF